MTCWLINNLTVKHKTNCFLFWFVVKTNPFFEKSIKSKEVKKNHDDLWRHMFVSMELLLMLWERETQLVIIVKWDYILERIVVVNCFDARYLMKVKFVESFFDRFCWLLVYRDASKARWIVYLWKLCSFDESCDILIIRWISFHWKNQLFVRWIVHWMY